MGESLTGADAETLCVFSNLFSKFQQHIPIMISIYLSVLLYIMNIKGVSHSEDGEDYGPNIATGARSIPDDQGDLEVCTRFAISKAIVLNALNALICNYPICNDYP